MPEMGIQPGRKRLKKRQSRSRPPARRTGLADAIFTRTQQKVLGLLFGQPDRSFFATEIINLASGGSGAVQRELARLEQSGLVTTSRIGNQKHYRANRESPLFQELASIVTKTSGIAEPLRAALEPFKQKIQLAMVYGSVAKGSDASASDIDLLVVSDGVRLEQLFKAIDPVEKKLSRKVSPTLYTMEEFRGRRGTHGFVTRVLEGPHILLMGSTDGASTA